MKGNIVTGPNRDELANAMFHGGERVSFVVRPDETGENATIFAIITEVQSDGTYHGGKRNGVILKGNCKVEDSVRSVSFEALYNMCTVPDEENKFFGRFYTK